MLFRTHRRHFVTLLCVGFLTLFVVSDASAGQKRDRGAKEKAAVQRLLIVDAVNPAERSITIEGTKYTISAATRLTDGDGNRIRLRDVHGAGGVAGSDQVRIQTRGATREISVLEVVPMGMP
jgi:hypothetical protein